MTDTDMASDHYVATVQLNHYVRNEECAADYGSYGSISFAGVATEQAIRLAGHDDYRSRLTISSTAPVWVGKKEQITNGTPSGWQQLATMPPTVIKNKQEVWVMHTGVAAVIQFVNERWEPNE